jgi:hypothetical protein
MDQRRKRDLLLALHVHLDAADERPAMRGNRASRRRSLSPVGEAVGMRLLRRRCGRDDPASCVPKNRADPPRPGAPGAKPEFGELEGSRAHSACVLLRSRRVTRQLADRRRLACSLCTTRSTVVAIGETAVSCFQPARSWLTAELARLVGDRSRPLCRADPAVSTFAGAVRLDPGSAPLSLEAIKVGRADPSGHDPGRGDIGFIPKPTRRRICSQSSTR